MEQDIYKIQYKQYQKTTHHTLTADGSVYSWGYNYYGQFGINKGTGEDANPYPVKCKKYQI